MSDSNRSVSEILSPVLRQLVGSPLPIGFEFWDGSHAGPQHGPTLRLRAADALRHLLWAPGELGLARGYTTGAIELVGDATDAIQRLRRSPIDGPLDCAKALPSLVRSMHELGVPVTPLPPPPIEARQRGRRHTVHRDAAAISHHYDVGNEFYELLLGPSMTYSCARFADDGMDLTEAQTDKHELICRKLGLGERAGARLLDIGCGWGSLAIHAAQRYGATVVGVTLSAQQAAAARERVAEAGVAELVEIRLADYRSLDSGSFDAIASVGMFEHVGAARAPEYFATVQRLLTPAGRFLNHAISSVGGSRLKPRSFMYRYVFPDGELRDVADVVSGMEAVGLEVRDVESLREHYARTVRAWLDNLEREWDRAVQLVGIERARVWRLYLAGSAVGFTDGGISIHQVLGVRATSDGESGMPRTRDDWSTSFVSRRGLGWGGGGGVVG